MRVLALSRYWNIINYFYPYKNYTGVLWENVLLTEIPDFEQADDSVKYYAALNSLISKVNDSHCRLLNNPHYSEILSSKKKLPVEFKVINGNVYIVRFENSNYAKPYYEIGDEVLSLDSIPTDSLLKRYTNKISSSNINSYYRDVAQRLGWSKDSVVQLKIRRGEKYFDIKGFTYPLVELNRDLDQVNELLPHHLLPGGIAYISLAAVNRFKIGSVLRRYRKCPGIILTRSSICSNFSYMAATAAGSFSKVIFSIKSLILGLSIYRYCLQIGYLIAPHKD